MTAKEFSMKSHLTIDELKNLPEVVIRNIIEIKEERLYGTYLSKKDRDDIEWEIEFFQNALKERFEKHSVTKNTAKKTSKTKEVATVK